MDSQRMRLLQESIEHSRTSKVNGRGERFDYTPKCYVAFSVPPASDRGRRLWPLGDSDLYLSGETSRGPNMHESLNAWGLMRKLAWQDVLLVLAVLLLARLLVLLVRWAVRRTAEKLPSRLRLTVLRVAPLARLLIDVGAIAIVVPILVEPTFQNIVALLASIGLVLAFALKDYGSSLVAGLVTILENTYQPGDWIEVDGTYGEVKAIGLRAVHLVTPDDTEVIIPHSRLWSASIFNASSGNRSLLCVADFYLHADHDALAVRRRLTEMATSSSYRKPGTPVTVIVVEKPWGTHYRVKAYVKESREQFLLITDLTLLGKEALQAMNIQFAQAVYAEAGRS